MPEGNHSSFRRLRNLGKGIFRIAFKTQEKMGNKAYVKIVPVGLDFSDYIKHYQTLHVNYGKPIEVSDYWDTFMENGPRGLNQLKQRLTDELKPLMIHIETEDFYDTYLGLRTVYNERMRELLGIEGKKLKDKFDADKEMIDRLNKVLEQDEKKMIPLKEKVESYFYKIDVMNIRDWVVKIKGYSFLRVVWRFLTLFVTLPVFIYGFINNALMYFIPVRMVKNVKDVQFHSSIKAGASILLVLPITYFIQTLLVGLFTDGWYIWLGYLITVYPLGRLALLWYLRLKKTLRGAWFGAKYRQGNKEAHSLVELREAIISETDALISR
jgi:hypothetical protein